MSNKQIFLLLVLTVVLITGCGSGKSSVTSIQSLPGYTWSNDSIFHDVSVLNGSGQVTLAVNGSVGTLIAIPYNTASSEANYSSTITISADSQTISANMISLKGNHIIQSTVNTKFQKKLRERERELLSTLRSKTNYSALKKLAFSTRSYDYQSDLTNLTFYKDSNTVTATKKYDGTYCMVYIDKNTSGSNVSDSILTSLGQTFDSFYSNIINYFGNPSSSLDAYLKTHSNFTKNDKVYILITELAHDNSGWEAGYFYGINEFPKSSVSTESTYYSNQKKMLFITSFKPATINDDQWVNTIKGTLAHEFQHLIFFNNRFLKYLDETVSDFNTVYNSETWINEGLSMVAEDLAIKGPGYNHNSDLDERVKTYLDGSTIDSLCTWGDNVTDYAPAYMFMRYFIDRYGEDKIKSLITNNSLGTNMLTSVASGSTFNQLFRDWLAAVILDRIGYSFSDTTYNTNYLYKTLNLASYTGVKLGTLNTGTIAIPDTTGGYIIKTGLSGTQKLTVSINGDLNFGLRLILIPTSFTVNY